MSRWTEPVAVPMWVVAVIIFATVQRFVVTAHWWDYLIVVGLTAVMWLALRWRSR